MTNASPDPTSPARRIEEARRVVARLSDDVAAWFTRWQQSPSGPYHKTRLAVLKAALDGHIVKLTAYAANLPGQRTAGEVYREVRAVESVAAWVRKLWEYYRSRFDQRLVPSPPAGAVAAPAGAPKAGVAPNSRPAPGEVLAAADEVLWSCYSPVAKKGKAAPLAFIDDQARTTAVYESGSSASRLPVPSAAQTLLDKYINTLPIPLVGLSPVVADAPWWLALVGHEVGHIVHDQYECLDAFRTSLTTIAGQRWTPWAAEVFADWYSVAA